MPQSDPVRKGANVKRSKLKRVLGKEAICVDEKIAYGYIVRIEMA